MTNWGMLAAKLLEEADDAKGTDRRAFGRQSAPSSSSAVVKTHLRLPGVPVRFKDLSMTGAGFLYPHRMTVDRRIVLELYWREQRQSILARVAHCKEDGAAFFVGVEFEEELPSGDVSATLPADWLKLLE